MNHAIGGIIDNLAAHGVRVEYFEWVCTKCLKSQRVLQAKPDDGFECRYCKHINSTKYVTGMWNQLLLIFF